MSWTFEWGKLAGLTLAVFLLLRLGYALVNRIGRREKRRGRCGWLCDRCEERHPGATMKPCPCGCGRLVCPGCAEAIARSQEAIRESN